MMYSWLILTNILRPWTGLSGLFRQNQSSQRYWSRYTTPCYRGIKWYCKKYDFDIVIGSIHVVDKTDLHNGDFCRNKSKNEAYLRYLEAVLECINLFDNFDILGHIDLIRRYGCYDDKTLKLDDFKDRVDAILKALVEKGKGLEVNTSGFRYNLDSPMRTMKL